MKRKLQLKLSALLLLLGAHIAHGQAVGSASFGLERGQTPPLQVSGQFQFTRANAPPGQCGCFWMTGGGGEITRNFTPTWSAVIDVYYGHNGQVNNTDEALTVLNYVIGPRYSYRTDSRYTPYAVALAGASHVGSNYYVYTSNNTFLAAQAGLGVEMYLTPRISAVPFEADWVFSRAVNGVNTRQNNLRVGVGVVYRLGSR